MKKTVLFPAHKELSARFISFAGWQMPFHYSSPSQEHLQTRKTVGLFDVSHMGQIRIKGKDSLSFLERLLPSDLESLKPYQALYSVLCRPDGGLIEDLIVYAFSPENYLLCVNSASKEKDLKWLISQQQSEQVEIQDESDHYALLAIQGPKSEDLCQRVFPGTDFRSLKRFHFTEQTGKIFARTGYTGEEGFEIYITVKEALGLWRELLKKGEEFLVTPVGLGARDTLRLEMAYLLAGQDFTEAHSPLQAGLAWVLKSKKDYIGKRALEQQRAKKSLSPTLQAFVMSENRAIPRSKSLVYSLEGDLIGEVTSGAKSPSLNQMIGLAYIKGSHKEFFIEIRGVRHKALRAKKPFLDNKKRAKKA